MQPVFESHIHYTFDIPLAEMIDIFRQEFANTGTEKYCFTSLPHQAENGVVTYDEMQNLKGLYLKHVFSPNAHAFAGLVHPQQHPTSPAEQEALADNFLAQVKEYVKAGFDGIKMLEGYPSLVKAWNLPIDSPVYDKFYAFMADNGYPLLMHIANPQENWDIRTASADAIQAGRCYDNTYPTKSELTEQVFRVLDKHPRLTLTLAHFGFMSYDIREAERFMSYPNTRFDITPGGEQLLRMRKSWAEWLPFWEKHQTRIVYGSDFYAFPKDENWETSYQRRPKFLRQFLETNEEHNYLGEPFVGVKLPQSMLEWIYRKNFLRLMDIAAPIDLDYIARNAKALLTAENKRSPYAQADLQYILSHL